jgi:hypothetical protein
MMTIIIVISMEGEDFLVTYLPSKIPARIRVFRLEYIH